jgi:uncharacterized protein (DUF1499 family)
MKMPTLITLGFICLIALCVFRFWPIPTPDQSIDIFTADHGHKPNFYISTQSEGTFNVSAPQLQSALDAQIAKSPRMKQLYTNTEIGFRTLYVERSLIFGFPDFIWIKIEQQGANNAIITLFSQSKFGYSDIGVNRKRVKNILAGLRQQVGT